MLNHEWPAEDYAIGSYIQATIAKRFLNELILKPTDELLDIGCGNASFTKEILHMVPQGQVLGMDYSYNMLQLARQVQAEYGNLQLKQGDVLTMAFKNQFDAIVSFWCLQWVADIKAAFQKMHRALKSGGQLFTVFPSGDDAFISTYQAVRESKQYSSLAHFHPPMDYRQFDNLEHKLTENAPFTHIEVRRIPQSLLLPSLDIYRKFVNGIAFYQGQLTAEEIAKVNEAMVEVFSKTAPKEGNNYLFNCSIYLVKATK